MIASYSIRAIGDRVALVRTDADGTTISEMTLVQAGTVLRQLQRAMQDAVETDLAWRCQA